MASIRQKDRSAMPAPSPSKTSHERPRLTEQEKKANHIKAEQNRRGGIRGECDTLCTIVPGLDGQGKSEAVVLVKTLKYMREKIVERQDIIARAKAKGIDTEGWELERKTYDECEAQLTRIREEQDEQRRKGEPDSTDSEDAQ